MCAVIVIFAISANLEFSTCFMESLRSLLRGTDAPSTVVQAASVSFVVEVADKMIISTLGEDSRPLLRAAYVQNGTLAIICVHPAAAQEIKLQERQLIEKINQRIGKIVVRKVKFITEP